MRTCQAQLLLFPELKEALRRVTFYLVHSDSVLLLLLARFRIGAALIFDQELITDQERFERW